MKPSTKDEIQGEKDKIKGKVKEGFGKFTGNRDLEEEGKDDEPRIIRSSKEPSFEEACRGYLCRLCWQDRL